MNAVAFVGGRIHTMDPALPDAGVVVVCDGRIAAVGARELLAAHPGAEVVELGDRALSPGFIDAHNHLSIAALHPRWRDVSGAATVDDVLAAVREQAQAEPDAAWVRCCNWRDFPVGVQLSADDLDRAGVDRPVIVAHFSLHVGAVNHAALDALGIGRETPDPPGGEILRGPDGAPTGVLVERAWSEAHARSLVAYADPDRWAEHIEARAHALLADGITALHDAACSPDAAAVYRSLVASGRLPISVLMMPHAAALVCNDAGAWLDGPRTGEGDERLRVGPLKLFADGGIAIALDATVGGHPVRGGILMADLEERMLEAAALGFRVGVHAIGNAGVRHAIDAFDAVARRHPGGDHRFRLEHAGLSAPSDARDLAALGAVAVVQPGFVDHVGEAAGGVTFDDHTWLAFAQLAKAGVPLAGSSDDPCAPHAPLACASRGTTRRTSTGRLFEPGESVPYSDWLWAYTAGAAFAGGQEGERGSLTPGKVADLVVLDGALDAESPPRVVETWVGGTCAYRGA